MPSCTDSIGKKSEVLQCLFRLTQSQKLRVHNFQCIDDMTLQDIRVGKTFTFLDFQCPKKFAHVDMSEGSMDLLLTNGDHDILLHPENGLWTQSFGRPNITLFSKKRKYGTMFFYHHKNANRAMEEWTLTLQYIHKSKQKGPMGIGQRGS